MIELSQDLAFDLEPGLHGVGERPAEHHLDGYPLFELGIRALGEKDLAHTADTQGAEHAVGSDTFSFHAESMLPRPGRRQTERELAARGRDRV